jgi:hypothetical protein
MEYRNLRRESRYFYPDELLDLDNESHSIENITVLCIDKNNIDVNGMSECPICYEEVHESEMVSTGCNHKYCSTCIEKCIETSYNQYSSLSCPLCRSLCSLIETYSEKTFTDLSNVVNDIQLEMDVKERVSMRMASQMIRSSMENLVRENLEELNQNPTQEYAVNDNIPETLRGLVTRVITFPRSDRYLPPSTFGGTRNSTEELSDYDYDSDDLRDAGISSLHYYVNDSEEDNHGW